jgi:crotonobetainyl-CoA:carnitine CoA-transferase CaiB-like acyl-CoA transferase
MAQKAVTGKAAQPMPVRISAWAIYDVFETAREGEQLFVGVVSDGQWVSFCKEFGLALGDDPALARNNQRVEAREQILPVVRELFSGMDRADLVARLEKVGLPFAPILRPDELSDDPHLLAEGGLLEIEIPGKGMARLPNLPLEIDGWRASLRHDLPAPGADGDAIMAALSGRSET